MAKNLDVTLILVMCAVWAGNYFVVKGVLAYVDPITFSLLRASLGGVFIFLIGGYAIRGLRLSDVGWLALIGFFNVSAFLVLFNIGLTTTSPGVASTLVYTQPVFVVALSPLVGERLTPRRAVGVLAAFAGVVLIFLSSLLALTFAVGDFYELCASLSWATAIILFKRWGSSADSRVVSGTQLLLGSAFILPAFFLQTPHLEPALPFWVFLAYNVVLATGAGFVIFWRVLSRMQAAEFTSYLFLVPVLATAMGSLMTLSLPVWNEVAGTALVAVGIVVSNR